MIRGEIAKVSRQDLPDRLIVELKTPGPIKLTGPNGSGKSRTLTEIAERLSSNRTAHTLIHHSNASALPKINQLARNTVILFDGIEHTDEATLEAILRHAEHTPIICTMRSDLQVDAYDDALRDIANRSQTIAATIARTRHFHVAPLSTGDAIEVAVKLGTPLDSVTTISIFKLAWGRPGWLADLMQIGASGRIRTDPHPRILPLNTSDFILPSIRDLFNESRPKISAEARAAAVTLSMLEARSLGGTIDIFGEQIVNELRSAGILVDSPTGTNLYGVPPLYGAALIDHANAKLLQRSNALAASILLEQEAFGIPLPPAEAAFCVRALRRRNTRSNAPAGTEPQGLEKIHSRLTEQLATTLVLFGRPEARDLLLRIRNLEGFTRLRRFQAIGSLRGPIEAVRAMRTSDPQTVTAEHDACGEDYGIAFLRQLFLAEINPPATGPRHTQQLPATELDQAEFVFQRWNDTGSVGHDAPLLLEIAQTHPLPEVALLAEQLLALENAQRGRSMRLLPEGPTERSARIAAFALTGSEHLNDLVTTSAVIAGLVSLLTAENSTGAAMLFQACENLPGSEYHALWIRHLFSAMTAAAAGNATHAAKEWTLFEECAPRFLPLRLRASISAVGAALRGEDLTELAKESAAHQLLAYFNGDFDRVDVRRAQREDRLSRATDAVPLAINRIAAAHIDAHKSENPAQLLRVADQLLENELWAPAAFALQEARNIFLRRRSAGSVARCDERLHELESIARTKIGWFSLDKLSQTPPVSLTPRQLDTARLASSGLSNAEIAAKLRCSVRTVESHLSAARAKLGVSSRSEVAEALRELGLQ